MKCAFTNAFAIENILVPNTEKCQFIPWYTSKGFILHFTRCGLSEWNSNETFRIPSSATSVFLHFGHVVFKSLLLPKQTSTDLYYDFWIVNNIMLLDWIFWMLIISFWHFLRKIFLINTSMVARRITLYSIFWTIY